jgi:hypothetical protein
MPGFYTTRLRQEVLGEVLTVLDTAKKRWPRNDPREKKALARLNGARFLTTERRRHARFAGNQGI